METSMKPYVSAAAVSRFLKQKGWGISTRSGDDGIRVTQSRLGTVGIRAQYEGTSRGPRYAKLVGEDLTAAGYTVDVRDTGVTVTASPSKRTTRKPTGL